MKKKTQLIKYIPFLHLIALCFFRVSSGPCPAIGHSATYWYTSTRESYSQTEADRGGMQGETLIDWHFIIAEGVNVISAHWT